MSPRLWLAMLAWLSLPLPAQYLRGVNLAGAEFGQANLPGVMGRDYTYNSEASFRYFAQRGLRLFRLPVRWERLQQTLGGPLDPANLAALRRNVDWARLHRSVVLIDQHNFGRWSARDYIIDNVYEGEVKVSRADFADFWRRISIEFKDDNAVLGYGLTNEPHDMGSADWKQISQAAVNAIRSTGDTKLIHVAGNNWSNSHVWLERNGAEDWIIDPANNIEYEAHTYFDRDFSGRYLETYDQELARDPQLASIGRRRVEPFISWCRANNVRCFSGEYGAPGGDSRWLAVLDSFLDTLDEAMLSGAAWAAGEWWPAAYILSIHPLQNFSVDRPHMAVLERHLPKDTFLSFPAATAAGVALPPGSLAAGYGSGLAGGVAQAAALPWPLTLGGVAVELTDTAGHTARAPLLLVSPGQINYLVPATLAGGNATVRVLRDGAEVAAGRIWVARTGPSLFSADGSGRGLAAAHFQRVRPDGTQAWEPVARWDAREQKYVAVPADFGPPGDRLFLVLYGSGLRGNADMAAVRLRAGAATLAPLYAGAHSEFPGLDQVVAELPRALAGSGGMFLILRVAGKSANVLHVVF